jgi:hypothetical protein
MRVRRGARTAGRIGRLACALAASAVATAAAAQGFDAAQQRRLERAGGTDWVVGATLQRAIAPGERDTTHGIFTVDRGALHLEGRWNYEAVDAGALFAGWTWRRHGDVSVVFVPMLGVAFGSLRGVVPALKLDVAWRAFDVYVEAEYVRDVEEPDRSLLYAWTELGVSPGGGWRLGAVGQRSRPFSSQRETQRGLFVQFETGPATLGLYLFEPTDPSRRVTVLSVGAGF